MIKQKILTTTISLLVGLVGIKTVTSNIIEKDDNVVFDEIVEKYYNSNTHSKRGYEKALYAFYEIEAITGIDFDESDLLDFKRLYDENDGDDMTTRELSELVGQWTKEKLESIN